MVEITFKGLDDRPELPDGAEVQRDGDWLVISLEADVVPASYVLDSEQPGNIEVTGDGEGHASRRGGSGEARRTGRGAGNAWSRK